MRYITVPAPIEVKPPPETQGQPEALTFRRYAFTVWLNDDRAIAGPFTRQVRWADVIRKFETTEHPDVIALEDEDYATLKGIVEQPGLRMPPTVSAQLLGFSRAVLEAPATDPRGLAATAPS